MSDDFGNEHKPGPDDNLHAFEIEIDKEIDFLFVPEGEKPPDILESDESFLEKIDTVPDPFSPVFSDPAAIDLEIDREIDSLFVPADHVPLTASRHSEAVSEKPDDLSDDPSTRALASLASAELDIDREIDTLFVPADQVPLTASRHSEAVSEKPDDLSDDPSTRALASRPPPNST